MLYPTCEDRRTNGSQRLGRGFLYGTAGNPTHHALEDMVAAIEGGTRCQIVSTGLAAVTVPLLAYLSAGDHLLHAGQRVRPGPQLRGQLSDAHERRHHLLRSRKSTG